LHNYFVFRMPNAMFCVFVPAATPWVEGGVFNIRLPMQKDAMGGYLSKLSVSAMIKREMRKTAVVFHKCVFHILFV